MPLHFMPLNLVWTYKVIRPVITLDIMELE